MKQKLFLLVLMLFSDTAFTQANSFVIGGREAKPGEYPEVIRISSGSAYCSATIVGPKVVVTAAHCTSEGGYIYPAAHPDIAVQPFTYARCNIAPKYTESVGDQDLAYCLTDREMDVPFASIASREPKLGDSTVIAGYGCVNPGSGTGGNDGKLRVGKAPVTRVATSTYFSYHTTGSTAVCYGDSGGPNFVNMTDPFKVHHYVIGVNSRADIYRESLLTSVAHAESISFAKTWALQNGVEICGVNTQCDDSEEEPKPQEPTTCFEAFVALQKQVAELAACFVK